MYRCEAATIAGFIQQLPADSVARSANHASRPDPARGLGNLANKFSTMSGHGAYFEVLSDGAFVFRPTQVGRAPPGT